MIHDVRRGSTLLLDPDTPGPAPTAVDRYGPRPVPGDTAVVLVDPADDAPDDGPAGAHASFRTPVLVLLAAAAVYLGYCSLGVIATDGSRWASSLSSGPGALVVGGALLAAGLVLTRPLGAGRQPGPSAVAWSAAAVFGASLAVVVVGGRVAADTLGATELLLAAVSAGSAVAVERRRRTAGHRRARSVESGGIG